MNIATATSLPAAPPSLAPVRQRIAAIDVIRGVALFGVLMVNLVTEFRVSLFEQFIETPPPASWLDGLLGSVVELGLSMKAFSLFALLFGLGLAVQYERLAPRGQPHVWLLRRLFALLGFGLVHLLLIWNGDILTEYALAGLLMLPLLRASAGWTALVALLALTWFGAQTFMPGWIPWPDYPALQQHVAQANALLPHAGLAATLRFSWQELPMLGALHLFVLPRTLGLFALGMWLWKAGIFKHPQQHLLAIQATALVTLLLGGAMVTAGQLGLYGDLGPWRSFANNMPTVLIALGYGAALLALMQRSAAARVLAVFAPLGRMAFTNYLTQSLVFCLIFFGYGLGQFGKMSVSAAFLLGLGVYVAQILLSAWWLRRYRYGPVEWLWRTLMYGQRQPMRKAVR